MPEEVGQYGGPEMVESFIRNLVNPEKDQWFFWDASRRNFTKISENDRGRVIFLETFCIPIQRGPSLEGPGGTLRLFLDLFRFS